MNFTGVMCLKNEELLVDLALKSAATFCNDFVIIDNECTDRTMEIVMETVTAEKLKVQIFRRAGWLRDIRHFAFTQAKGDWIVLADGDHIWQTEGEHAAIKLHEVVKTQKDLFVYALPLVRLFYDYYHTSLRYPVQPPHRMVFPNKPNCWLIATEQTDIPVALRPILGVPDYFCCWNVGIKRPGRIFRRRFWGKWVSTGAMSQGKTLEEFMCSVLGMPPEEIDSHAEKWLKHMVFETPFHPAVKADQYGGYPAMIAAEIARGINRRADMPIDELRALLKGANP